MKDDVAYHPNRDSWGQRKAPLNSSCTQSDAPQNFYTEKRYLFIGTAQLVKKSMLSSLKHEVLVEQKHKGKRKASILIAMDSNLLAMASNL